MTICPKCKKGSLIKQTSFAYDGYVLVCDNTRDECEYDDWSNAIPTARMD